MDVWALALELSVFWATLYLDSVRGGAHYLDPRFRWRDLAPKAFSCCLTPLAIYLVGNDCSVEWATTHCMLDLLLLVGTSFAVGHMLAIVILLAWRDCKHLVS